MTRKYEDIHIPLENDEEIRVMQWALERLDNYVENLSDDQDRCAECGLENPDSAYMDKEVCKCGSDALYNWGGDTGKVADINFQVQLIIPSGPGYLWTELPEILEHDIEESDDDAWIDHGGTKPDPKVGKELAKRVNLTCINFKGAS